MKRSFILLNSALFRSFASKLMQRIEESTIAAGAKEGAAENYAQPAVLAEMTVVNVSAPGESTCFYRV